jgi:thiamine-monophosphate kinase
VAGVIDLDAVPRTHGSTAAQAASGGDDYELCFTIAPDDRARLNDLPERVSVIGRIEAGSGVSLRSGGRAVELPRGGFRHFR